MPGQLSAGQPVDCDDAEKAAFHLRRQAMLKLGRDQPVEIHRDLGKADRMVFAGDAEADELEELVIAGGTQAISFLSLCVSMRRIDKTLPRYCSTSRIDVWKASSALFAKLVVRLSRSE